MKNAGGVGGGESVGDADEQLHDVPPRARGASHPILERAALDELGDEVLAAVPLAGFEDCDEMRMIETRVAREIDVTHAPVAEGGFDLVRPELRAGGRV